MGCRLLYCSQVYTLHTGHNIFTLFGFYSFWNKLVLLVGKGRLVILSGAEVLSLFSKIPFLLGWRGPRDMSLDSDWSRRLYIICVQPRQRIWRNLRGKGKLVVFICIDSHQFEYTYNSCWTWRVHVHVRLSKDLFSLNFFFDENLLSFLLKIFLSDWTRFKKREAAGDEL